MAGNGDQGLGTGENLLQAILDELREMNRRLAIQNGAVRSEEARQLGALLSDPVKGPAAIRANNERVLREARTAARRKS